MFVHYAEVPHHRAVRLVDHEIELNALSHFRGDGIETTMSVAKLFDDV